MTADSDAGRDARLSLPLSSLVASRPEQGRKLDEADSLGRECGNKSESVAFENAENCGQICQRENGIVQG